MVQHAWIHIPDYPDPFEVTSWLCSKVDQGQCQNYPFLIVHFKCKSNYTKWSNMRLSIFRITRIVCGHKFTLFKSEPRSGSKSFFIVHFNIQVRIYPDSSTVGHDPFLGQYNPESVANWPGTVAKWPGTVSNWLWPVTNLPWTVANWPCTVAN